MRTRPRRAHLAWKSTRSRRVKVVQQFIFHHFIGSITPGAAPARCPFANMIKGHGAVAMDGEKHCV